MKLTGHKLVSIYRRCAIAAGTPEPVYLFEPEVPRVTRVTGPGPTPRSDR